MTNRHTLAVLVENKPGVLTRVAALFARRAFNIKSLTVGETEHPEISRMTIIVDADSAPIEQVVKQLNKLINVLKVVELEPEDSVERRLLLMKVQADETRRTSVLQIVDTVASVVHEHEGVADPSLDDIVAAQRWADQRARELVRVGQWKDM